VQLACEFEASTNVRKPAFDLSDSVSSFLKQDLAGASFSIRHGMSAMPCLARQRSQALKPRKRHAEGVGLDGNAQRQARLFRP
jgi:hypothetical protein